MKSLTFEFEGQIVKAHPKESVLAACLRQGILLDNSCEGNGTCGTCRVIEIESSVEPLRNEIEQEMAVERKFKPSERLACQVEVVAGLKLRRP